MRALVHRDLDIIIDVMALTISQAICDVTDISLIKIKNQIIL